MRLVLTYDDGTRIDVAEGIAPQDLRAALADPVAAGEVLAELDTARVRRALDILLFGSPRT